MAKRSLYASPEGASLARKIFDRRGWTQENLAAELDLRTRQPIWRFFTCRPIERHIFIEICTILDLNWWEIVAQVPEQLANVEAKGSDEQLRASHLVEKIRLKHQDRLEYQCGMLRLPGTNSPAPLADLYVEPRLLDRIVGQTHLDITQLAEGCTEALSNLREHRFKDSIASPDLVLEKQPRLCILGKPGSGKTTLLKRVALQCIRGQFQPNLIPVFIKLGNYAASSQPKEFSLQHCIQRELVECSIADSQIIETLLIEGRFLLLLDELDEISGFEQYPSILREITRFFELYHRNRVILTARLGRQDLDLPSFSDFEVLDFDDVQIASLARKSFQVLDRSGPAKEVSPMARTDYFLQQLNSPVNRLIRELAGVPLLLNRICQVFCGKNNLSDNRLQIYEECLNLYLKASKLHQPVQPKTSVLRLTYFEQLYILERIAVFGLQEGRSLFERSELERLFEISICELQKGIDHRFTLREEIANQVRLLFLHQGILLEQARDVISFSHIAFQEYLASKQIASCLNWEQDSRDLLSYLTDPAWQGVFTLASNRLRDRDLLLEQIKVEIQALLSCQPHIQVLLDELQQKSGKWLVYHQISSVYSLLCQIARTPEQLCYLASPIVYMRIFGQQLLFEVVLAKLLFWFAVPNWRDEQVYGVIQPLLDQVLMLTTHYRSQKLTDCFSHLREQVLRCDWSATGPEKQRAQRSIWLESLAKAVNEYTVRTDNLRLNVECMRALELYLYMIQLLADCQHQDEINSYRGLLTQFADLFPSSELKETLADSSARGSEIPSQDQLTSSSAELSVDSASLLCMQF